MCPENQTKNAMLFLFMHRLFLLNHDVVDFLMTDDRSVAMVVQLNRLKSMIHRKDCLAMMDEYLLEISYNNRSYFHNRQRDFFDYPQLKH